MNYSTAVAADLETKDTGMARHKVAPATLDSAMRWRYAVRRFSDEILSAEELDTLIEAVRHSPSAYGLQPYELIVISSKAMRERLLSHSYGQEKIVNCSHLLVFAAYRDIDDGLVERYISLAAKERGVQPEELAQYANQVRSALASQTPQQRAASAVNQSFLALGTLLTSAALLGIDCCPMSGFESSGYDKVLGLPERGLTAAVICALGRRHPQDSSALYPRVRVPRRDWLLEYQA
ncbi:Oxygen-insensitive NAD(P)H nitroreductase [Halioglobus japonicus]|nr:Oxygen-insensitive NAD(P)H nitroreductase [Halioglobus japonicus]